MATPLHSISPSQELGQEEPMNTEVAEAKSFLIWVVLWLAALMVLLPALAGN